MKSKFLLLLLVIFTFSCSIEDEIENSEIENSQETLKLLATDNGNLNEVEEVIALIHYKSDITPDDIIEIRSRFFSDCTNPISLGCVDDLTVELHRTTGTITYEYWMISRCGDDKKIHCPENVKDAIGDGGIGEVY